MKAVLFLLVLFSVSSGTFYQLQCRNSNCTEGCRKISFPEDTCIPVEGGGSAKVTCGSGYVSEEVWTNSDCSGPPATRTRDPTGVCEEGSQPGVYFENICTKGLLLSKANYERLFHG